MARWKPLVRKDSYMPNNKMTPLVIGNGYTTDWGANGLPPVYETVTGNPVSFSTVQAAPLRQLEVAFSPVQDLHGYDAPWPAGGGANQWDEEWENGRFDLSTGALVADNNSYRSKNYIPAKGSTQYFAKSNTNVAVGCWNDSKQYIGRVPSSFKDASFTTLANTAYIKFYSAASSYAGGTSINYPATVTTYSPYQNICPISGWDSVTVYHSGADTSDPQTILISIGQTVYSGTLDVVTGVVTVDRGIIVLDGTQSMSVSSANQICSIASPFKGMASAEIALYQSDTFKAHINSGVANMNNEFTVDGYHVLLVKAPSLFTTNAEAKAYFTANPTTFVAPLTTPQIIQLTPQQVSSLLGENNMWSDANGDLTVEYRSN